MFYRLLKTYSIIFHLYSQLWSTCHNVFMYMVFVYLDKFYYIINDIATFGFHLFVTVWILCTKIYHITPEQFWECNCSHLIFPAKYIVSNVELGKHIAIYVVRTFNWNEWKPLAGLLIHSWINAFYRLLNYLHVLRVYNLSNLRNDES